MTNLIMLESIQFVDLGEITLKIIKERIGKGKLKKVLWKLPFRWFEGLRPSQPPSSLF